MLRARRQWPCSRRAADECDEVASFHSITSSARASSAGLERANSGHHHLLIDTDLPPLDQPIPNDFNHLHYGAGQTEAEISLKPGTHTVRNVILVSKQ